MSSDDFLNEEEINKIFGELTNSLTPDGGEPEDTSLSLDLKEILLLQQSFIDAQANIYHLVLFSSEEQEDGQIPHVLNFSSNNKINYYFAAMYKIVEDFNNFMLEFIGEDIEEIFEEDEDDGNDEN